MPNPLAVLGPTNTGKTHLALERMMGHASGMIGFPLRLLARENYDKVVRLKGKDKVALITGEERIVPSRPQWYVCTVESMPIDRPVEFLAIDEIQLCGDLERGHIFTDRLLNARGLQETMFLGALTIRPLIAKLVPRVRFETRPRLSKLVYDGPRKLTRLPKRSALVAFSAGEVYGMAELIRRQRGGAAVVLGALSPRTRNAQVAMYQAGEVDYLVATDAIGMGLNMDIDHVAFASLRKFDGRGPRELAAAELAQIAGRAGRHMNDGSFGTTSDCEPLAPETVQAVENHHFPPLRYLSWRNAELRFASIDALLFDLDRPPPAPGLIRAGSAEDHLVLQTLARDEDIRQLARHPERVRLLWEVCQIPDFRKTLPEEHARLVGQIFRRLAGPEARLADDWLAAQIERLDRTEGDIDHLSGRIAGIRTWTYVAHRGDWVNDPLHWQELARAVEDRLSDALHEKLTSRFVDRRTSLLARKLKEKGHLPAAVAEDGQVEIEGHAIGTLEGFRFCPAQAEGQKAARVVTAAAEAALKGEIARRLERLKEARESEFSLTDEGGLAWNGVEMAKLAQGAHKLKPALWIPTSDLLDATQKAALEALLAMRRDALIALHLQPLLHLREAPLKGAASGLAFQLAEGLGSLPAFPLRGLVAQIGRPERQALGRLGVRLGLESVYLPALLKAGPRRLRSLLQAAAVGQPPLLPAPARILLPAGHHPAAFWEAAGFRRLGRHALRLDILERLALDLLQQSRKGPALLSPGLLTLLGASQETAEEILAVLGWRKAKEGGFVRRAPKRPPEKEADQASPFAALKALSQR
jgi:ATP-dependent RNA helicase SUPV3L1/SUV3